jgi:predicted HicB family RNase H-like nuclease
MTKIRTAGGDELSEQDIEALADEAERGYDLDKAIKVTVGRPSLGTKGASPRLSFRATPELYRAVQCRAKKEGRSVSDLAREAVSQFVRS